VPSPAVDEEEWVDIMGGAQGTTEDAMEDILGHWTGPGLSVGPASYTQMGPTTRGSTGDDLYQLAQAQEDRAVASRRQARVEQENVRTRLKDLHTTQKSLRLLPLEQMEPERATQSAHRIVDAREHDGVFGDGIIASGGSSRTQGTSEGTSNGRASANLDPKLRPLPRLGWIEAANASLALPATREQIRLLQGTDPAQASNLLKLHRGLARHEAEFSILLAYSMSQAAAEAAAASAAVSRRGPWLPASRALLDVDATSLWLPVTGPEEYARRRVPQAKKAEAVEALLAGSSRRGGTNGAAPVGSTIPPDGTSAEPSSAVPPEDSLHADLLALGTDDRTDAEDRKLRPRELTSDSGSWQ